jgi:glutaredoxin 3
VRPPPSAGRRGADRCADTRTGRTYHVIVVLGSNRGALDYQPSPSYLSEGSSLGKDRGMAKVEIYSDMFCGYCARAKSLLTRKGIAFEEIDVGAHPERRPEMTKRAGGRTTVPQIFINGEHIGGSDDLILLDRQGGLDPKLAS